MKLSKVKRRNRLIGIVAAALLFQSAGLDPWLRVIGGPVFSFVVLLALFFIFPLVIEFLERKLVK